MASTSARRERAPVPEPRGRMWPPARERVRFPAIIITFAAGSAFICLALLGDLVFGWRQSLFPSLFLEVGSSIALGGLLFLLERQFTTTVRISQRETRGEIDRSREEIKDRLRVTERRLVDLEQASEERALLRHAATAANVDRLLESPDHDVLASLLTQEHVAPVVTVGTTAAPDAFRLALSLTEADRVSVSYWGSDEALTFDLPNVVWAEDMDELGFFDALRAGLDGEGLVAEAQALSPQAILRSLHRTLATDVEARTDHSAMGFRGAGRVVERFDENWVLTTRGLVHRQRGLVFTHPVSKRDLIAETEMSPSARRVFLGLSPRVGRLVDDR